jgi:DNA polymerase I-like protein with 3'-5' exonuclease and polymerase domains
MERTLPILKDVMENCIKLSVPLEVEFKASIDVSWGSQEKIKVKG